MIMRKVTTYDNQQINVLILKRHAGDLPETLEQIADDVSPTLARITWRGTARER